MIYIEITCNFKAHSTTLKLLPFSSKPIVYWGDALALWLVRRIPPGSRSPGSSPGLVIVLCSWARNFTLTVPLSTQEYKWAPVNCQGNLTECWGVTYDGLASHPGGAERLVAASYYGNRDKFWQSWATRLVRLNRQYTSQYAAMDSLRLCALTY